MNAGDKLVLVCVPEAWDHVAKSWLSACETCGQTVWISPSGWAGANEIAPPGTISIVCVHCVDLDNAEIIPPTLGQLEAIKHEAAERAERNQTR